jgi:hypothetical protein
MLKSGDKNESRIKKRARQFWWVPSIVMFFGLLFWFFTSPAVARRLRLATGGRFANHLGVPSP